MSLAELLVSLVIVGIIMTTLGSVMVLTGRVVGLSAAQAVEARVDDVVGNFAAEQRMALRILELTARSITFLVDRDHDGTTEKVRYAWSGVPGDDLTRQVNDGTPVAVARNVRRFNLSYLFRSTPAATSAPDVEIGTDTLLYAHTAGSGSHGVSSVNWVAQYFKPDWAAVAPGETVTAWRITRVEVVASKAFGSSGTSPWVVRVYSAGTDSKPVLIDKKDEQTLPVSSMATTSSPTAYISTGTFAANSGLDPAKGMCITVGPNLTSPSGYVGVDNASTDPAGAFMTSSNGGVSYATPSATRDLRIRVWGRYSHPGP